MASQMRHEDLTMIISLSLNYHDCCNIAGLSLSEILSLNMTIWLRNPAPVEGDFKHPRWCMIGQPSSVLIVLLRDSNQQNL